MDPLSAEDRRTFRKGVGILLSLLYLAPERPDMMYVLKKLSAKLASPVEADMELLRYTAKYLKGTPDLWLMHKKSYPGKSFLEMKNRSASKNEERNVYKKQSMTQIGLGSRQRPDKVFHVERLLC